MQLQEVVYVENKNKIVCNACACARACVRAVEYILALTQAHAHVHARRHTHIHAKTVLNIHAKTVLTETQSIR